METTETTQAQTDAFIQQQAMTTMTWDLDADSEAWFRLAVRAEKSGHHDVADDFLRMALSLEREAKARARERIAINAKTISAQDYPPGAAPVHGSTLA